MKRIYHPWSKWEDFQHGFFGKVTAKEKPEKLQLCADFFRDLNLFDESLAHITQYWTYSCEHNLTNDSLNKIAYLGQVACAYKFGVPCDVASAGYNLLNPDEKRAADQVAQKYLDKWTQQHGVQNVTA